MCNLNTDTSSHSPSTPPDASSPSSYFKNLKNSMDYYLPCPASVTSVDHHHHPELHRWPSTSEAMDEIKAIGKISGPTVMTGLLWYSRAMVSMLFLGYLGELELAGGSLAIGFANITGYSVISGLAMGMEPICGQAYGAKQMKLLGLTLQRTVLLLFSVSIPISFLWLNMKSILTLCGQDESISSVAHVFIVFSIPDLFLLALLHPLRIYLRTQNITLPITYCSAVSVLIHVPLNFILVVYFKMGIAGVAMAMIWTNANLVFLLLCFVLISGVYKPSWVAPSIDCVRGWTSLLSLAIPTCASVCLEWWWYEFMILLCGLLSNPQATISSMGILIQTTSLVYVFPSALSLGVSTRVGNELGANRPVKARFCMMVSLACSVLLGLTAMTFTTLMRHRWGRLFTNDPEILKLTAIALPIIGLCELGNCPQTTGCGVLRGCARPKVGANINLGSFYLVGMPVGILMGFVAKLGFAGLWVGLLAAQASCALLMLIVLTKTDWILQAERASELTKSPNSKTNSSLPISTTLSKTVESIKVEVNNISINNETILCIDDELLKSPLTKESDPAPLVRSESTESVGSRKGKKKAQAADSGDSSPTKSANKLSATARAFVPAAAATPQPPLARTASHNEEKDGDFHYFYQAADGQQVYLHAVNYQCLITEYGGSPSTLPPVLSAQLMDVDSYVMDEDNRRKFRFLSHLPLTSSFHIFFVDLSPILSTATINQFSDKLAQRLKRREAMAKEQERLSRLAREAVERESLARSKSHPTYRLSENSDYASDDYDSMHGTPYRYAAPAPPDANESSHFPELKSDSGNKVSLSPPGSPTHTNAAPRVTGWSTLAQKGFASSTMWAALPAKSTPSQGPSQPGSQGLSLSPKLQSSQSSLSPEKTPSHGELPQHAAHEPFSLSSSVPISSGPPASSHSAWGSVSSAQSPQTIIGNLVASTYGVSPHVSASYVPPPAPAAAGGGDKSKKGGKKKKEVLFGVSSHHHYK